MSNTPQRPLPSTLLGQLGAASLATAEGSEPRQVAGTPPGFRRRPLAQTGLEGNVQELGGCLSVFETLGDHPERQGVHPGDGPIAVRTMGHHAGPTKLPTPSQQPSPRVDAAVAAPLLSV
jgi:hypothetical protein